MIDRDEYIEEYGLQVDPLFDMVDGLQAQLQQYRWVPCADMLPKIGSQFLIYDSRYEDDEDYCCIGMGRMTRSGGISATGANYSSETITHWMPLPQPPEQEVSGVDDAQ